MLGPVRGVDGVVTRRPLPLDAYTGHAFVMAGLHEQRKSGRRDRHLQRLAVLAERGRG
jgi:hypothetical protein